MHVPD